VREGVEDLRRIDAVLNAEADTPPERRAKFDALIREFRGDTRPHRLFMAGVMERFAPGLFAGPDDPEIPNDNLDLERWFRNPKGHERRIHGHAHAGVRIVEEGPTLVPTLDAHLLHPTLFGSAELLPYAEAASPPCEHEAMHRRKVMRQARSNKQRAQLLATLEARAANTS
jgi:hypothetical protein